MIDVACKAHPMTKEAAKMKKPPSVAGTRVGTGGTILASVDISPEISNGNQT
jgi:hypothetical protein